MIGDKIVIHGSTSEQQLHTFEICRSDRKLIIELPFENKLYYKNYRLELKRTEDEFLEIFNR